MISWSVPVKLNIFEFILILYIERKKKHKTGERKQCSKCNKNLGREESSPAVNMCEHVPCASQATKAIGAKRRVLPANCISHRPFQEFPDSPSEPLVSACTLGRTTQTWATFSATVLDSFPPSVPTSSSSFNDRFLSVQVWTNLGSSPSAEGGVFPLPISVSLAVASSVQFLGYFASLCSRLLCALRGIDLPFRRRVILYRSQVAFMSSGQ